MRPIFAMFVETCDIDVRSNIISQEEWIDLGFNSDTRPIILWIINVGEEPRILKLITVLILMSAQYRLTDKPNIIFSASKVNNRAQIRVTERFA